MILRLSEKADQSLFKVPYELLQLREVYIRINIKTTVVKYDHVHLYLLSISNS